MRTRIILSFLILFVSVFITNAQEITQSIKGVVVDKQSEIPLIGASVQLLNSDYNLGSVTDVNGFFTLRNVPLGRQELVVSYIGYNQINIPNVEVTAGKEVYLSLELEESIFEMQEVVVTAEVDKDRAQNELATVSARTFSLEEVTRYSGGRNDVSRLVSNYAGVSTADDSRNDIVIRGNSPTGVLWRLEGIPIPNPNHYSTLGTTGGPVSAINTNLLKNSDFLTSAFPAEYGNALAGVFDLSFRSGNKDKYEFTAQMAAFSGLEFMAEGPMNQKKASSFIVSYRYSFAGLGESVGIPVGTNATPYYQDLSFKLDFGNSKIGKFSIFGIGGASEIDFLGDEIDDNDLFANLNEDAFPRSKLAIAGLKHNLILNNTTYLQTVISGSVNQSLYTQDNLLESGTKLRVTEVDDLTRRLALNSFANKKFNAKTTLRTGAMIQNIGLQSNVMDRNGRPDLDNDGLPDWFEVRNVNDQLNLFEAYAQLQHKINRQWTLNIGMHGQYLDYTKATSLEPRMAINWNVHPKHTLTVAYGLHTQIPALPLLFLQEEVEDDVFEPTNADLDFVRSNHFVFAHDWKLSNAWRAKTELYYQLIQNVPVQQEPSSFSALNVGDDFVFPDDKFDLVNRGSGFNYGIELTLERFFQNGYYALLTCSVFESKYEGSDGIERNTAFNNKYVFNLLGGKEFKVGRNKQNAFTFDFKLTQAGGRYYTPVDLEASKTIGSQVLKEDEAYSLRYDPYFRLDTKFGFRYNSNKRNISQQFFLDFQNLTDHDNVFAVRYNEVTNEINTSYQSGFFPDILYRIQF
jgi:hypothetical protein